MRSLALFLMAAVGCSRASVPHDAPPPADSLAHASVVDAATHPDATCPLAAGYQGTILGHRVFARLGRDRARLYGRYFYENAGIDLRLDGTLSNTDAVQLTEGEPDASSGSFSGTCDGATGAIDGTWTGAKASGPFHLEPIAPGEVALAAMKRFAATRRVHKPDPDARIKDCSYSESRVELFGLRDASVEQAINGQGLEPFTGPRLELALAHSVEKCSDGFGFEAESQQTLVDSFRELATLETSGSIDSGGAHPGELSFSRQTIDLRTGHPVTPHDVFVRNPLPRVIACVTRAKPYGASLEGDDAAAHFDPARFDLGEDGVHFFGQDYPHVMAVLDGEGPVIPYDVLLRDGYLRGDSPVKRAWAGVSAAPKDKGQDWCPEQTWSTWWK